MFACVRMRMHLCVCQCLRMHVRTLIWAKRTAVVAKIKLPL